jgi:hypothetical protein
MPRPLKQIEPDIERMITSMGEIHCTKKEICTILGIDDETFNSRYSLLWEKAKENGRNKLRGAIFNNALQNNNVAAQIFLSKNYLGMSDNHGLEISGPGGGPVELAAVRDKLHGKLSGIIIDTPALESHNVALIDAPMQQLDAKSCVEAQVIEAKPLSDDESSRVVLRVVFDTFYSSSSRSGFSRNFTHKPLKTLSATGK